MRLKIKMGTLGINLFLLDQSTPSIHGLCFIYVYILSYIFIIYIRTNSESDLSLWRDTILEFKFLYL